MFGKKEGGRFIEVYKHHKGGGSTLVNTVIKDIETGVLYLQRAYTGCVALVPLTDADGKPLVETE